MKNENSERVTKDPYEEKTR